MSRSGWKRGDYEVVPFHANGTGGMAMMQLAAEGYFSGILDLGHPRTGRRPHGRLLRRHRRKNGLNRSGGSPYRASSYRAAWTASFWNSTRDTVPPQFKDRKIFFYDFRSAIRVNAQESRLLAGQLSEKLNMDTENVRVLIPLEGFSVADQEDGPLHDPATARVFVDALKEGLDPGIPVETADVHINDPLFADQAVAMMDRMVKGSD